MIDTSATSVNLYDRAPTKAGRWAVPCIAILCGISFFIGLDREPHFVDESAYVSQAYFGDLFITGSIHSPLWFEYPAYDLPPLTKYLVWSGLVAGGDPRPGPSAMRAWYSDTSKRFETVSSLRHARQPIALCGLITVLATGLIAQRWRGNLVAICSMILVTIHPLFRTHARRSMADVPTEMGVVLALLAFMPFVNKQKPAWRMVILGGIATGMAASSNCVGTGRYRAKSQSNSRNRLYASGRHHWGNLFYSLESVFLFVPSGDQGSKPEYDQRNGPLGTCQIRH